MSARAVQVRRKLNGGSTVGLGDDRRAGPLRDGIPEKRVARDAALAELHELIRPSPNGNDRGWRAR